MGLSVPAMLALGGMAIVGGIVLVPYVAPMMGMGDINIAADTLSGMHSLPEGIGFAKEFNDVIAYIPYLGTELAKGGLTTSITTAVTGIGGVLLGNWVSKNHEGHEGIDWGQVIKWGALATSALIALPAILTGISNSVVYVVNELLAHKAITVELGGTIADGVLNGIGVIPYQEPMDLGFTGAAVTLPHLLSCGFTMFPLAAGFGAHKIASKKKDYVAHDTKGKPLPGDDRNHEITQEEYALIENYNNANSTQKILLKKEILARGYDPDFHSDGTVHLYKHGDHSQSIAR